MKNKSALTLMELLIMLLVFALAAALCLQAFAAADRISEHSAALDRAVLEAQNAAETLKNCGGDYESAANLYGGTWDGGSWRVEVEAGQLTAAPQDSPHPLTDSALITVTDGDGAVLYTLSVTWQKGGNGP